VIIQRIEIENFRSLRSIALECDSAGSPDSRSLVAVLGRNGGGKSSILYALDIFYDVNARVTPEDCYARDARNEIMIRVTYGSLRADEKSEFASYVHADQLIVTKKIQFSGTVAVQKYYAAAKQIRKFADLRALGKRERVARFKELVGSKEIVGLDGNPRSGDEVDQIITKFESEHRDLAETIEREEQFFGPKEVGGGKLDKFTKFVLVPAARLATGEMQKKGVVHELIETIVLRRVNEREDVKALRKEMQERIETVFSQGNLSELSELGTSISTLLGQYSPGAEFRLSWDNAVAPAISLPAARADLVEDDFACPISHAGHGLQRALVLTLLQQLAMTQKPVESVGQSGSTSPAGAGPAIAVGTDTKVVAAPAPQNPDLILAIEEPELYLHPSRCRHLSELLFKLAEPPKSPTSVRTQVFYATHSPYFVDLHRFDQVRIARKPRIDGQPAPCCAISQYSLGAAAAELARIALGNAADFTRDTFRARSLPVMTTAVNEGFFATTVVVVEGLSEVGILWRVQEELEQEWSARGIVVVPAMGKQNIDRPVVIFRGLNIPTYFIFDADGKDKGKGKEGEKTAERNRRYLRLAGGEVVDFPQTTVTDKWAVFATDVETAIKEAVGNEVYDKVAQQAVDELKYEGAKSLMKNTEGAGRVVELIYRGGNFIDVVEEIVQKITALCDLARNLEIKTIAPMRPATAKKIQARSAFAAAATN
jgi:putative ATP-dependent endonuclease of the OLD family